MYDAWLSIKTPAKNANGFLEQNKQNKMGFGGKEVSVRGHQRQRAPQHFPAILQVLQSLHLCHDFLVTSTNPASHPFLKDKDYFLYKSLSNQW